MDDQNSPSQLGAHWTQPRPKPSFVNPQKTAENGALQVDAAPVQVHAGAPAPPQDFKVSVDEIVLRLQERDIKKSKDTIQRYCRDGTLECQKLGVLRRYYATEKSVSTMIEEHTKDAGASSGMQVHAGAKEENTNENNDLHEAVSTRMQVHAVPDEMADFLKEQIRIKDGQLLEKDKQIDAMLERDRETNVLIRNLQQMLLPKPKDDNPKSD